ncbi:unnamed protein product [Adineta ricciae]|uniref:Uncharacterized protein n=1 Tax=Adineta ricciae TaxID=249248 RepID=A0A814JH99_ADIRI|nr:unnamed protein product [Adineta ricciae]
MATGECENFRIGREFLESVAWPSQLRKPVHDRCYCYQCYPSSHPDALTVAGYKYVIPHGWTRFAVSVDSDICELHNVWSTWLVCYHGTSIESARSCVEHRQLLLPNDITMYGKKLEIPKGHIPKEHYIFTTPSITYAAHQAYARAYHFRSPHDSRLYTIKVVLQCRQKPDSIIVQPETVGAQVRMQRICTHIPNEELEWKTQHRSSVVIYGLLLQIKKCDENDTSNLTSLPSSSSTTHYNSIPTISNTIPRDPLNKLSGTVSPISMSIDSTDEYSVERDAMSSKQVSVLIMILIATFLPVAALVVGQIYKSDCPIQPWIPQWMTVFGAVGIGVFGTTFTILLISFKCCGEDSHIGRCTTNCFIVVNIDDMAALEYFVEYSKTSPYYKCIQQEATAALARILVLKEHELIKHEGHDKHVG